MRSKIGVSVIATMHTLNTTLRQEVPEPVKGTVTGTIPKWIEGSLYRNGPGMFEFGEHKYNHFYDGMAMIQRFHIANGEVTYQRRFLQTDTFKANTEANANVVGEFGTRPIPDPCKNIFRRFLSRFEKKNLTDNTLVNMFPMNEDLFATTETSFINKIHPDSLDKLEKIDLLKSADMFLTAAHPHWEPDGTVHYLGLNFSGGLKTHIVTFKPEQGQSDFSKSKPVCTLTSPWKVHSPYYHSFGITENYYILVEQSMMYDVTKLALMPVTGNTSETALTWYPDTPTRFRIIDKKTGSVVNDHVRYETDALLLFHHINAYEEDGHVVLDLACHKDKRVLENFYMKNIASEDWEASFRKTSKPIARRYILPLHVESENGTDGNLVSLKHTEATCARKDEKTLHCTFETLADVGMEFPTISYDGYNGKKYRYIYGLKMNTTDDNPFSVLKIDAETKTYTEWGHPKYYPSEPIFIPHPGGKDEDDGVIVAAINRSDWEDGHNPFLVVLDAKTLEEIGRGEISGVERFSPTLHGIFRPK